MTIKNNVESCKIAEKLTNELTDPAYSKNKDKLANKSFTLPHSLAIKIEDIAYKNKRNNIEPKTFSAIVRDALEAKLKRRGKKTGKK